MLSISNGWFARTISGQRVQRVTSAGYAAQHPALADLALYMGPVDTAIDTCCFGGAKRHALHHLFEIARRTRLMQQAAPATQPASASIRAVGELANRQALQQHQQQLNQLLCAVQVEARCDRPTDTSAARATPDAYLVVKFADRRPALAQAISAMQVSSAAPAFATTGHLRATDLTAIRKAGGLRIGASEFAVRCDTADGPLVFAHADDAAVTSVQAALSLHLLREKAEQGLARLTVLTPVDTKLPLTPSFIGLRGPEQDPEAASKTEKMWATQYQTIQRDFAESMRRMEQPLLQQRDALVKQLQQLLDVTATTPDLLSTLDGLSQQIDQLHALHEVLLRNRDRIHAEFKGICILIGACKSIMMVDLIVLRIARFSHLVSTFSRSKRSAAEVRQFNANLDVGLQFFSEFGATQIQQCADLLCPTPESDIETLEVNTASFSVQHAKLVELLKDSSASWSNIAAAMKNLHQAQVAAVALRKHQIDMAVSLSVSLQHLSPTDIDGFRCERVDGQHTPTYYSPTTYSRIVSIYLMYHLLQSKQNHYTWRQLEKLTHIANDHIRLIGNELNIILDNLRRAERHFSFRPSEPILRHYPYQRANGQLAMHEEVQQLQRKQAFQRKVDKIESALQETNLVMADNFQKLSRRSVDLRAVGIKTQQLNKDGALLHERASKRMEQAGSQAI